MSYFLNSVIREWEFDIDDKENIKVLFWVMQDPLKDGRACTRAIGMREKGGKLVPLIRVYDKLKNFVGFYVFEEGETLFKIDYSTVRLNSEDINFSSSLNFERAVQKGKIKGLFKEY